jgi:hypothetical protein
MSIVIQWMRPMLAAISATAIIVEEKVRIPIRIRFAQEARREDPSRVDVIFVQGHSDRMQPQHGRPSL